MSQNRPPEQQSPGASANQEEGYGTYFLGRYRVVDEIGIGGMASVHLARMDGAGGFQKWVAIKRIHPHLIEDEHFIHMFLDEARIAARISHPNVAQVFDLGEHENTYWIAMEYLHGEPLREIMRFNEDKGLATDPRLAARIIADAAEGLHAAHELRGRNGEPLNLVHRDVSPHNLFITYEGMVKVVDFGIAKVSGRLSSTRAGTLKGKLAYMSPEQVRGAPIDRRTDVFALGVVLWELVTGQRLFRMDSDLETLERVQTCVVAPPSSVRPGVPAELEAVIMRTLKRQPETRFQTSRELSRALQQYLMRGGQFVGAEEVSAYISMIFHDRIQKRETHLRWAAEVTQTIAIDDLRGTAQAAKDEPSALSYDENKLNDGDQEEGPPTVMVRRPPSPPAHAPTHGIHKPAPRVDPQYAAPQSSVVISATPPSNPLIAPGMYPFVDDPDEEDNIATVVVSSKIDLSSGARHKPPLPAAGSPAPVPAAGSPAPVQASQRRHEATLPPNRVPGPPPLHPMAYQQSPAAPPPWQNIPQEATSPIPAPRQNQPFGNFGHIPPGVSPGAYAPPGVFSPDETLRVESLQRRNRIPIYLAAAVAAFIVVVAIAFVIFVRLSQPAQHSVPTPSAHSSFATGAGHPSAEEPRSPEAPSDSVSASPPAAATPPPKTASGPTKTSAKGPTPADAGYLTVVCTPACDGVSASGRNLGPSPVVRAPLPPGQYRVTLRRSGKPSKVISTIIVSGKASSHKVSMD